ncbi:hypothetical protein FRX31_016602, partial [Thalictrum thalictroides]
VLIHVDLVLVNGRHHKLISYHTLVRLGFPSNINSSLMICDSNLTVWLGVHQMRARYQGWRWFGCMAWSPCHGWFRSSYWN